MAESDRQESECAMKIQKSDKLMAALDEIAMERSISDEDNYRILNLINEGNPVIQFANCETFEAPPFDRCRNDTDKRKMMASILTMGTARNIQKFNAYNIAENIDLVMDLYRNMEEFHEDIFQNDPYLSHVSLPLFYDASFSFSFHTYEKNRLFHFAQPVEKGNHDILRLGYFMGNANYPYITRNGSYFASVSVHEIMTAKKMIAPVSGNVLITGLSIGYLPYLAHIKDSVHSVTVIEEDEVIISLFQKEILPQFIHKEKIHVIHENIHSFMEENDQKYDCIIWNHYEDSLTGVKEYLKMKQYESSHRNTKYICKLEESILSNIKSGILMMCIREMMEEGEEIYRSFMEDASSADTMHALEPVFENHEVKSVKDLQKLFQNTELRKIIFRNVNNI